MAKAKKLTLDEVYAKIKEGEIRDLNIIIKGDVQGSVEAIKAAFENITHPEVKVNVIHCSVGGINESDVMLASASKAIVIGFNVQAEAVARKLADSEGVSICMYDIIYRLTEDIEKALKGMLEPEEKMTVIGHAEVKAVFHISKVGNIAGCRVTDGELRRYGRARVLRKGKLSLKARFHH